MKSSNWRKPDETRFFGSWLPFIGWQTVAFEDDGSIVDPSREDFDPSAEYEARSVFCIAWFNWCILMGAYND